MTKLRVLVVHNRYQYRGGEDAVVDAEIALLRDHGHGVEAYLRDNRDIPDMGRLDAFTQTLWSRRTWNDLGKMIEAFRPDVIHAHNTFPLISASLYWAASRADVPVVQTLHNFRLLCAQAMLLYDGRVCEDCLGKLPWRGVMRKCYRKSGLQSAALVTMLGLHRAIGTFDSRVTRYIALNEFCRRKFVEGGLPSSRVLVKPNFVSVPKPPEAKRRGGLFVGRLAPEKGIDTLLEALSLVPGLTLDVIGTGPERSKVEIHPQIRFLGWLGQGEVYEKMRHAAYLVMPSLWYENFPRTLVEAFANGLPVIASHLGAMSELIEHGHTGLLFEPGSPEDLARHMAWAEAFPRRMSAMGAEARAEYEAKFTPEKNYRRLMEIYGDAIDAVKLGIAV